jgi:hypothetical protein
VQLLQEIEQQLIDPSADSIWRDVQIVGVHPHQNDEYQKVTIEDWLESVSLEQAVLAFITVDGSEAYFSEADMTDALYRYTNGMQVPAKLFAISMPGKIERDKFLTQFINFLSEEFKGRIEANTLLLREQKADEIDAMLDAEREGAPTSTKNDITDWAGVSADAIDLLRGVFPYVEWEKEVRGLSAVDPIVKTKKPVGLR